MSYTVHHQYAPWPSPTPVEYPSPSFDQVESSIGPSRVLTRAQRTKHHNQLGGVLVGQRLTRTAARAQTPSHTLIMPGSSSTSNHTTTATATTTTYPLTPDGSSYSPYPSYPAHGHHSRSNSNSVSNGRSASPALSTITTSSHSSSANNTQNHSALLSPFVRNAYSPVAASPPGIADSPAASPVAIRPKQRKQRLFNVDRQAICQYHIANPTARQEDIAARYGVERSTISKILKHKAKWLNVCPEEGLRVAKHRPSKFPEIESSMRSWLHALHSSSPQGNSPSFSKKSPLLSDTRLREKALSLAKEFQIPEDKFKASSGWVENFKHRHGIRNGIWEAGAGRGRAFARVCVDAEGRLDQDKAVMDAEPYGDDPETPSEYGGSQRVLRHDSQQVNDLPPQRPGFRRSWTEPSVRVDGVEMSQSNGTLHHNYQHQSPRYPGYPPASQAYESISHSSSSSGSDPHSYDHSISHSSSAPTSHVYQPPIMPPPINTNVAPSHSLQQPTPIDSHPNSFGSASSDHSHSHSDSISAHVHHLDDESRPPISPSGRRMVPTIPELPPGINVPPLPTPVLRLPDNSPPSLEDAERSLDRVLLFVNTLPLGQEILTQEQKDQLHEIKCVLFKVGAGIPFR